MNPTPEHKEQAREIARFFFHGDPLPVIGGRVWASAQSSPEPALADYIAEALTTRDAEIREVLEGLSTLIHYTHGQPERCWCNNQNSNWTHTQECLAARDLYAKLQPGEKS